MKNIIYAAVAAIAVILAGTSKVHADQDFHSNQSPEKSYVNLGQRTINDARDLTRYSKTQLRNRGVTIEKLGAVASLSHETEMTGSPSVSQNDVLVPSGPEQGNSVESAKSLMASRVTPAAASQLDSIQIQQIPLTEHHDAWKAILGFGLLIGGAISTVLLFKYPSTHMWANMLKSVIAGAQFGIGAAFIARWRRASYR